jgi:AraC-like DNA-binding protein
MLESGDEPLDVVARRCGLGSPETLRRAFQRHYGVPPAAYRARFRATVPPAVNQVTRIASSGPGTG